MGSSGCAGATLWLSVDPEPELRRGQLEHGSESGVERSVCNL